MVCLRPIKLYTTIIKDRILNSSVNQEFRIVATQRSFICAAVFTRLLQAQKGINLGNLTSFYIDFLYQRAYPSTP